MGATADVVFNAVDLYNSATGAWSTAQLSVGRSRLAAASVGNVAIFAGGYRSVLLLIEDACLCMCFMFVAENPKPKAVLLRAFALRAIAVS